MTTGEKAFGIRFENHSGSMHDLIKHQGAQWIDLSETFKTDEKKELIEQAQAKFKEGVELLLKAINEKSDHPKSN